jgi:hypothetical protein
MWTPQPLAAESSLSRSFLAVAVAALVAACSSGGGPDRGAAPARADRLPWIDVHVHLVGKTSRTGSSSECLMGRGACGPLGPPAHDENRLSWACAASGTTSQTPRGTPGVRSEFDVGAYGTPH